MGEAFNACIQITSIDLLVTRYEFPQYEALTCLKCLPLESSSVESGYRNFIVASTIVDRAEDLAARGAVSKNDSNIGPRLLGLPFVLRSMHRFMSLRLWKSFPTTKSRNSIN